MRNKQNRTTRKQSTDRKIVDMLSQAGENRALIGERLEEPSAGSLARLEAIPLLFDSQVDSQVTVGNVEFDSWSDSSAIALRDASDGHLRRLTLSAGSLQLELIAELRNGQWEFVARAYNDGEVAHQYILKAGRDQLSPRSNGYFIWESGPMPRTLELTSFDQVIKFEGISW